MAFALPEDTFGINLTGAFGSMLKKEEIYLQTNLFFVFFLRKN